MELLTIALPADEFNEIPTFEQQPHTISSTDLRAIGELFLQHHAHHDFCAGLLHRHQYLRDGEAMIHNGDTCSPYRLAELQSDDLAPHSFFLHRSRSFRPFEFALNRRLPRPTDDFFSDLQSLLQTKHLETVICVSPLPDIVNTRNEDVLVLETQLARGAGSHSSLETVTSVASHAGTAVVTNWAFARDAQGHVDIKEVKACVKNNVGIHEVKDCDIISDS